MKRLLAIWLALVLVCTGGAAGLVRAEEMPQSADWTVREQTEADMDEQTGGADPDGSVEAPAFVLPQDGGNPAEETPAEPASEETGIEEPVPELDTEPEPEAPADDQIIIEEPAEEEPATEEPEIEVPILEPATETEPEMPAEDPVTEEEPVEEPVAETEEEAPVNEAPSDEEALPAEAPQDIITEEAPEEPVEVVEVPVIPEEPELTDEPEAAEQTDGSGEAIVTDPEPETVLEAPDAGDTETVEVQDEPDQAETVPESGNEPAETENTEPETVPAEEQQPENNPDDESLPEEGTAADEPAEALESGTAETADPTSSDPEEDELIAEFGDEIEIVIPDTDADNADELLLAYLEKVLREAASRPMFRAIRVDGRLDETCLALYLDLKLKIEAIAAGDQDSSELSVSYADLGLPTRFTAEELGITISGPGDTENISAGVEKVAQQLKINYALVQLALLANCPYELYWYDKSQGARTTATPGMSLRRINGEYVYVVTSDYNVRMAVSRDYSVDTYKVDTSTGQRVQHSVMSAKSIVEKYKDLNDLEKLEAYRDEICNLVSYNGSAAGGGQAYGDPWQLVYVFDEDTGTNVVCEGYAKAFQYLCDMTKFDGDVNCYSVTGRMDWGTGAGTHMWNIVTMSDGQNYLVDLTNSDSGTIGSDGSLFLVGEAEEDGDALIFRNGKGQAIRYRYSDDTITLYTEKELTLSGKKYEPKCHLDLYPYHTLVGYPRIEPTCEDAGRAAYWYCQQDGRMFTDGVGTAELAEDDVEIPSLGHAYGEWTLTTAPTCEADGEETRVCAHDETHTETRPVEKLGHAYGEWILTTAPTCEADGEETRVCAHDETHTETRPVEKLGHAYGEWTLTTAPTCEADGEETRVCAHDATHIETRPVAKLGHAYGEWTLTTAPTCEADGEETRVCAHDETHIETRPVEKLGHAYGEWELTTAPTCEADGEETRVCAHDATHIETRPVEKLGHAYGEWELTTAPTCEADGEETRVCAHDATHIETRPVRAAGHCLAHQPARKATYAAEGQVEHWACAACGKLFADADGTVELTAGEIVIPKTEKTIVPDQDAAAETLDADAVNALAGMRIERIEEVLTAEELDEFNRLPLYSQLTLVAAVLGGDARIADENAAKLAQALLEKDGSTAAFREVYPFSVHPAAALQPAQAYEVWLVGGGERCLLLLVSGIPPTVLRAGTGE